MPAGTVLHACATTLTASGRYDSCSFAGTVTIRAANVVITRSLIKGQVYLPDDGVSTPGLQIIDSTIACGCPSTAGGTPPSIDGSNYTFLRVDEYGSGHGAAASSNVVIQDSWIHGEQASNEAHKDGVYVGDGTNSVISHNSIECNDGVRIVNGAPSSGCTAAIGLLSDFGVISHYAIDHNLLNDTGSFCFYGGGVSPKPYVANHIVFVDNVFGRADWPQCGYFGPVDYFDKPTAANGNAFARNTWVDGTPVTL